MRNLFNTVVSVRASQPVFPGERTSSIAWYCYVKILLYQLFKLSVHCHCFATCHLCHDLTAVSDLPVKAPQWAFSE